jgi:uncharacterized membrane protein (DUF2068 family)
MAHAKSSRDPVIRLIAVFKLLKASLLIALGVGAFKLLHKDMTEVAEHWISVFRLDPANHLIDKVVAKVANLPPDLIKKLGLGSFVYAGLFLTEGIGLWLLKRWAEWLTVIITSSLVPFEIYEIHRRPTVTRITALTINLAIVVYLVYHVRRSGPEESRQSRSTATSP